jgi:threonine aldolase
VTVDLRSDTVTRPTAGMRAAIAAAEVGDDIFGEDPTVRRLQEVAADRFGREAALFVPSGIMANVIWMRVLGRPGAEVVVESNGHLVAYEDGASALLAGVQFHTVPGDRGRLDADRVRGALRPAGFPYPDVAVIAVDETTNRGGGAIHGLERLRGLRALADERGAALYCDGARIFHAVVASGADPAAYGALVDGLSFCISKGLGAPVGSVLVGDAGAIDEAWRWRRRLGGQMRQAGVLAAAGLYALEHHVDRLAEDHANAAVLAARLADDVPGSVDPADVETNIVYVDTGDVPAAEVVSRAADAGVLVGAMGEHLLRLITHLDVDRAGCLRAADVLAGLLR